MFKYKRRPKSEEEFLRLEERFHAEVTKPKPMAAWQVWTTFAVGLRGRHIEVEFVDQRALINEDKPRAAIGTRQEAQALVTDLVFTPPPKMVRKLVACLPTGRVCYFLNNGVQVVDDMDRSLAVHIVKNKQLALDLVQQRITIKAAKERCGYLRRILHTGAWMDKVLSTIAAH